MAFSCCTSENKASAWEEHRDLKNNFNSESCFCGVDIFIIQAEASERESRLARKDGGLFYYSFVSVVLKNIPC